MPKKIDEELKARAVRLVQDHQGEYSSLTAAAAVVAKQLGVGTWASVTVRAATTRPVRFKAHCIASFSKRCNDHMNPPTGRMWFAHRARGTRRGERPPRSTRA